MAILSGVATVGRNNPAHLHALAALFLTCVLGIPLCAQASAQEYQVKAAFIYNFAKFVEWPPEAFKDGSGAIHICILGPSPLDWMIEDMVRNKNVDGHALEVRKFDNVNQAANCQILFVSASEQKHLRAILLSTKTNDSLTVGETDTFVADGGVIGFNLDRGRIHFDINLQAAQLQRLQISSKLLSLATSVRRAEK